MRKYKLKFYKKNENTMKLTKETEPIIDTDTLLVQYLWYMQEFAAQEEPVGNIYCQLVRIQ